MSEFKPITFTEEYANQYWEGPSNRFSRYATYWQRGLGWANEAKYVLAFLGLGIFKSDLVFPVWVLVVGGFFGMIVLILVGRWDLHKFSKAREFINGMNGSITGFKGYNMQVKMVEQNEEIIKQNEEIIKLLK